MNKNNSFNGKAGGSDSDLDAKKGDSISKGEDQVGGSTQGIQKSSLEKSNSSNQSESKEAQKAGTSTLENNDSGKKGEKKEKATEGSESKGKTNGVILLPVRKENFGGEECGLSDKCTAEKNALVACLRVPGNESPDLSLLIQNKGKGPLSVKISAPDFVWLEKTQIQLQENRNEQVKVTVKNGGTDNLIVLTAGNGNCSLSLKDLIAHSLRKEADYTSQSTYIKFFNRTPFVAFIIFAALLLLASIWTCLSFRRRHFPSNGSNYQKLDMELPISDGGKTDLELNAGWDDSWGDSWDDEEAPKTPSMPVTPSLSSQRISSRRVNKEGWKD